MPLSDATAKQVHRWSGRLAILFTLPVVFHCVTILGFQTTTLRVAVHSVAGSFIYGVFVAKMLVIRDKKHPSWALPVLGGAVAALLAVLWLTSSVWYWGEFGVELVIRALRDRRRGERRRSSSWRCRIRSSRTRPCPPPTAPPAT